MRIALVSFNPKVGDLEANLDRTIDYIQRAAEQKAVLVVFPELSLIGYPPQDLLLRPCFGANTERQLKALHAELQAKPTLKDIGVIVGTALSSPKDTGNPMLNCAVFLHGDQIQVRAKSLIPHYGVFNENRYFESALKLDAEYTAPVEFKGTKIGIVVCEDSWHLTARHGRRIYDIDPNQKQVDQGAEFLINLSASPYREGKKHDRRETMAAVARSTGVNFYYVNQSGANDEIIFDGDAFAMSGQGKLITDKPLFTEAITIVEAGQSASPDVQGGEENYLAELSEALQLGIRDYVRKNGFRSVMLGLSGGIDSAVVATLAAKALGPENVHAFTLPSKFSSVASIEDSEELARRQGIHCKNISIKFLQSTLDMALKPVFAGRPEDVTEENIQARVRGLLLMAVSNKFGHLLLTTGNKSELAVGYATLYGDMCGAVSPIGDVYKTRVYQLAKFFNRESEIIPKQIIEKAPSAELRPNQTDQDTLPDYALLDVMLEGFIEGDGSLEECEGFLRERGQTADRELLDKISHMLMLAEYKRKQYCPILRTSKRAFGIGRRYPLTAAIGKFH